MNKKVLTLTVLIAAISVGTYVALTVIKPHKQDEVKVADVYSSDQIFAGKLNPNGGDEVATNATTSGAEAASTAPAEAAPAATPEEAPAATTVASPEATPAASGNAMATPVEGGDATPAAAAPAPTEAAPAPVEPTQAPATPTPETTPPPAATAVEPSPTPAAAQPTPSAEPAASPKKKAVAKKKSSSSNATGATTKPWWPAENPNQLSLVYAGPASFKKAIVLMFNGAFFKPDSPNATIKITDGKGTAVSGTWELGENNRRMLVFPVVSNGKYKVSVGANLIDSKNRKLGKALSGSVVVH
jgi:hypothetical protein